MLIRLVRITAAFGTLCKLFPPPMTSESRQGRDERVVVLMGAGMMVEKKRGKYSQKLVPFSLFGMIPDLGA